jgi:hypothetical protein
VEGSFWYSVTVTNVPEGWEIYTSLLTTDSGAADIPMEKAAQFFFFASRSTKVLHKGNMRLVASGRASLPVPPADIFGFCDRSIQAHERFFGPNKYAKATLLLILQSPPDFDEITKKKTFSTGENYTGGIALYGPDREDVFTRLGHPTYLDFLLGGLHHEIGHSYTSAGPAKFKSLLYASSTCPRDDRLLIGEHLNGYFNGATRAAFDSQFIFSLQRFLSGMLSRIVEPERRSFTTDLFLLDLALRREEGISLYRVFREMLDEKRRRPGPFPSAEFLIRSAEALIGHEVSGQIRDLILAPQPAAYQTQLLDGLTARGWNLESLPNDRESAIKFFLG